MKVERYFLSILTVIVLGAIAFYFVGDPRTFRVRSEISSQLMSQLPKTYSSDGKTGNLQDVEITQITHGPKGYAVSVVVHYENTVTTTGFNLNSNGFGRLTCNTVGQLGPVGPYSLNIPE